MVRCMEVSQEKGYVWIGTRSGIGRFDGYEQRRYLRGNVTHILEDEEHTIWVITEKGIFRYNEIEDNFILVRDKDNNPVIASSLCLWEDGVIFGGRGRLYKYNYEDHIINLFHTLKPNGKYHISNLYQWDSHTLLATNRWAKALFIDIATGNTRPVPFNSEQIISLLIDRKGNVSIASIYGATPEEFSKLVLEIGDYVDMIELNISCPHAMEGYGASIGQDANLTHKIVSAAKDSANKPIIAKLTPNVTDIVEIAMAAQDAGADALTLINSLGPGMKINIDVAKPVLSNKFGGMSGKAIKPIALRNVYTVYDNVDIPIIGVGGISNFEDVVEFLFAGARAVQIGTVIMDEGVEVFSKINKGLEEFMNKKGYGSIDEMIGLAHEEL